MKAGGEVSNGVCLYYVSGCKLAGENGAAASEGAADIEEEEEDADGGNNDGDDEDDLGAITEIRFVPSDQGACECSR